MIGPRPTFYRPARDAAAEDSSAIVDELNRGARFTRTGIRPERDGRRHRRLGEHAVRRAAPRRRQPGACERAPRRKATLENLQLTLRGARTSRTCVCEDVGEEVDALPRARRFARSSIRMRAELHSGRGAYTPAGWGAVEHPGVARRDGEARTCYSGRDSASWSSIAGAKWVVLRAVNSDGFFLEASASNRSNFALGDVRLGQRAFQSKVITEVFPTFSAARSRTEGHAARVATPPRAACVGGNTADAVGDSPDHRAILGIADYRAVEDDEEDEEDARRASSDLE